MLMLSPWLLPPLLLLVTTVRGAPPPLRPVCPAGSASCRANFFSPTKCATGVHCNVCAECCHDELGKNATQCSDCVHKSCTAGSYGDYGCRLPTDSRCCPPGQRVSTTLPNCLLIGDSVAHGTWGLVKQKLEKTCAVSNIESVSSGAEDSCFWSTRTSATTGKPVDWAVVHYNEGLHSLWPRVNTSAQRAQYTADLTKFTQHLQTIKGARLIYATMTPFMPEKYLNPPGRKGQPFGSPQHDVEDKNALAVATVRAQGVTLIDDLYSAVTAVCGEVYRNCSLCDDESQYHPQGKCGYHYSAAGWELLATQTAQHISEALALGPAPPPPPPAPPPRPGGPPIRCAAPGASGWGSNVSCPSQSYGCAPRKIGSPRNGFPWSCIMPSVSSSSPPQKTTCSTGAPFNLSKTKKNILIIGDSVSNGYFVERCACPSPEALCGSSCCLRAGWDASD
jgi:hypothetical protein